MREVSELRRYDIGPVRRCWLHARCVVRGTGHATWHVNGILRELDSVLDRAVTFTWRAMWFAVGVLALVVWLGGAK